MSELFAFDEPEMLPAISMWQPYASLVFVTDPAFRKRHETRSFRYPAKYHGQRIALQASAAFPRRSLIPAGLHELAVRAFGSDYRQTLPRGAYLGTVVLGGCYPTESLIWHLGFADREAGVWDAGRFAWQLDGVRALPRPVPAKGKQGWWKVPAAALRDSGRLPKGEAGTAECEASQSGGCVDSRIAHPSSQPSPNTDGESR